MPGSPLRPGDPALVGPYPIVGRLGQGGQGVVYLGEGRTGEPVAVKVLHVSHAERPDARRRFIQEIEVARQIAEFCTARVLDAGETADSLYVVSEYIEGVSLQRSIEEEGPRAGAVLQRIAVGTVTALAAIHQAGIVHRDFKPGNVLLGPGGPRVIDFGISRALDASAAITSGAIGTPTYMSPEQIGGKRVGSASDVFSWAITMVYAATGRPAFGDDSIPAVLHRILSAEPDLSEVPESIRPLLARCLSKNPESRPTAAELLLKLITHTPPADDHPLPPIPLPPAHAPVPDPLRPPDPTPLQPPVHDPAPGADPGPGPVAASGPVAARGPVRTMGREERAWRVRRRGLVTGAVAVAVASVAVLAVTWPATRGEVRADPVTVVSAGPSGTPSPTPSTPPTTEPAGIGKVTGRAVGGPLRGHTDAVNAVAVARVGKAQVIVSGSRDRTLRLWDLATRKPLGTLTGHTGWVRSVATIELDGKPGAVSAGDDGSVRLWDLAARKAMGKINTGGPVFSATAATVDGKPIAVTGGRDGDVRVWNLATRKEIGRSRRAHEGAVFGVAFADIRGETVVLTAGADSQVRKWRIEDGKGQQVTQHGSQVSAVTTAELNGTTVVLSAGGDRKVRVEDPITGGEAREPYAEHTGWIYALAVVRAGKGVVVVSGGNDGTARVHDLATGETLGRPFKDHDHNVESVVVAESGGRLLAITGGGEGNVRIWRIT
ncbi:serine/threonine-protein kinase [Streptosporangium sp. KLBMP 9127]|nr:serine/threonine protein kinase [Streptosporangium sp. KLBMP 9127]